MFRRFPVFERLITWTKPDAPFERGTREYEWYDHNSLLAAEPEAVRSSRSSWTGPSACPPVPRWRRARAYAERTGLEIRYGCRWEGPAARTTVSCSSHPTGSTTAAQPCSRSASRALEGADPRNRGGAALHRDG